MKVMWCSTIEKVSFTFQDYFCHDEFCCFWLQIRPRPPLEGSSTTWRWKPVRKGFQVQTLLPVRIFHVYKEEQWNVRQCKEPSSPEETILQTLGDGHIYAIFFNIKLLVQFHSIGQFFCNLKELTISIKVFFPSNVKKGNLSGSTLILIFF